MEFQFSMHRDERGNWYYMVTLDGHTIQSGSHPSGGHDIVLHTAKQQMRSFERTYARCERCGANDRPRHLYYCSHYDTINERPSIIKRVMCDRHLKDSDVRGHDRDCIC